MIIRQSSAALAAANRYTIWGLDPVQLHDRFWAARGVQVVRQGEPSSIVDDAELFLLTSPKVFTIFKLRQLVDRLGWLKPVLLYVRLHDAGEHEYRERAVTDEYGRFIRFERNYNRGDTTLTRVTLTSHREVALAWQTASSTSEAWRLLRRSISRDQSAAAAISGSIYDCSIPREISQFIRGLISTWQWPDATITGIRKLNAQTWVDAEADVDSRTRFVGPVWVGAGRHLDSETSVVGPAVLWDEPDARPKNQSLRWEDIEPTEVFSQRVAPNFQSATSRRAKRIFDIAFALIALALTLPLYPLAILAIFLEDGRPFFFRHRRETKGGRTFSCIKFRSMHKDADAVKAQLAKKNTADGPQFFIEDDPRLTRVGRVLRRTNIDELPQFINVLLGHMSVVGPRPSPFNENQFCPGWREARLSVRPGITGLWQVRRSRLEGMDFQEWIKYDIEYVENAGWRLDLWIIWKTIPIVIRGVIR